MLGIQKSKRARVNMDCLFMQSSHRYLSFYLNLGSQIFFFAVYILFAQTKSSFYRLFLGPMEYLESGVSLSILNSFSCTQPHICVCTCRLVERVLSYIYSVMGIIIKDVPGLKTETGYHKS